MTDDDSAENGTAGIVYMFGGSVHAFSIDNRTGTIRLSSPLDFELQRLYNLTVCRFSPQSCNKSSVE